MINYERFKRLLTRCEEIAAEPIMNVGVVNVYTGVLKPVGDTFLKAHENVIAAESAFGKENHEAVAALGGLDASYRVARSVVLAFVPEVVLPATLKVQPTDTDKLNAIEALLDVLDDHAAETWADEQLKGEFGVAGAKAVKEINEAIAANKALAKAREVRAASYGPAYEKFMAFKRVVRNALGSKSKQYKRIHLRNAEAGSNGKGEAPEAAAPTAPGAASPGSAMPS